MTVQPSDPRDVRRAAEDEAERRHAIKQRAVELKRALLDSTLRLSPERAAAAYNEAARKARIAKVRSGPFLKLCVAVLSGALSMLVPIPSTCTLQGELTQLAAADGTAMGRRALVYAHPSQCVRLSVDEPAAIFLDGSTDAAVRVKGLMTRLALRAGSRDATCQIELQLLPEVQELPAVAKVTAVMPLQASTWLDAVLDRAAREESVHQASIALKSLGESAAQRSVILVEHLRNSQRMQQHYDTLRQIFVPEEQ